MDGNAFREGVNSIRKINFTIMIGLISNSKSITIYEKWIPYYNNIIYVMFDDVNKEQIRYHLHKNIIFSGMEVYGSHILSCW